MNDQTPGVIKKHPVYGKKVLQSYIISTSWVQNKAPGEGVVNIRYWDSNVSTTSNGGYNREEQSTFKKVGASALTMTIVD